MKFYCIHHQLPKPLANAHHIICYTGAVNCVPSAVCTRLLPTNLYMLKLIWVWNCGNKETYRAHTVVTYMHKLVPTLLFKGHTLWHIFTFNIPYMAAEYIMIFCVFNDLQ